MGQGNKGTPTFFKVILANYTIPFQEMVPIKDKGGKVTGHEKKESERPYEVRRAMFNIMLSRKQQHKGFRFYTFTQLAKKIKNCREDFIILDRADYDLLKFSFDNFTDFGQGDTELVARVYEAEKVNEGGSPASE